MVQAGVSSNYTENQQCGQPATAAEANAPGVEISFLCEPAVLAKYVSLDIDRARPGVTEESNLKIAEVTVEEYTSHYVNLPLEMDPSLPITNSGGYSPVWDRAIYPLNFSYLIVVNKVWTDC